MSLSSRQKEILAYLQRYHGVLSSSLLSEKFSISVQTIRKDMNELSDQGLVRRVHGGISLPSENDNLSFTNRSLINVSAKQKIAQAVVAQIPLGSSIFLGIGTTPKHIANALLDHPGVTVVTNNINAALTLSRNPNIVIHLAGGLVRNSDEDTVGETATAFYRQFNIKIAIFGVGGLGQNGELLDFSPEEASLTHAMMAQSHESWLVADRSKPGRYAPVVSGTLADIDRLFVDQSSPEFVALCQSNGVKLIIAD